MDAVIQNDSAGPPPQGAPDENERRSKMTRDQLRENIGIAFQSIRTQKARSLLTLLGVVIGVSSVIGVASIIEGLNNDVVGRIQMMGSKTFIVARIGPQFGRRSQEMRLRKHLKSSDAQAIRESSPTAEFVTVFADRRAFANPSQIRYGNELVNEVFLRGVDEYHSDAMAVMDVAQGRVISPYDSRHSRTVIVLGRAISEALFPFIDPIGRTVRLNGLPFEVIGVFVRDEGLFGGPGIDQMVTIPLSTFQKLYPDQREHAIAVSVRETSQVGQAVDEAVAALRRSRKVPPRKENDFDIFMPEFFTRIWKQLTGALFLLTFTISSIALLVGGIGVMNIMLVSVTQRTREIGVRKAVGARGQDVRMQFLTEAVALTCVGGVIGILVGSGLAWGAKLVYPALPVAVSLVWVCIAFTISVSIGLFFGYYPANRAAGLDPIVCLRYE